MKLNKIQKQKISLFIKKKFKGSDFKEAEKITHGIQKVVVLTFYNPRFSKIDEAYVDMDTFNKVIGDE